MADNREMILISYNKEELLQMIEGAVLKAIEQNKQDKEADQYLSRQETAALCSVTVQTLNNWVNAGRIKAHKINGRVLFRRSDIDAALIEKKILKH
ncbi:helix-turn-helix domain-containing protein [Dysgonomonas sp. Marseille-P4361]|uniref:helix-turn-helix domain-containing protein n=1 Tax=Dysgonomonas sp. Marseille-P4361 TaxID=2161820 RepID=UPI000D54E2C7|nr:helix-turn-helix domain-containing protein [Dysgonomonas sp. Marseille-P4361]